MVRFSKVHVNGTPKSLVMPMKIELVGSFRRYYCGGSGGLLNMTRFESSLLITFWIFTSVIVQQSPV